MNVNFYWRAILCVVFFCLFTSVKAQEKTILSYEEYVENILLYHPIAKKADLQLRKAKAERLGAKGVLDPILSAGFDQKHFDDKLYYRKYQAKLIIPTQLGINAVAGYENTEGYYLNPESKTDKYGLWNIGVEVDVLQGLVMNSRKVAIEKAKVFQSLAKSEQELMLNDLLYEAVEVYLIWQKYAYARAVWEENLTIAKNYLENTKQTFLRGEKTTVDTLEAFIAHQDALSYLQKNDIKLAKVEQSVENFLWFKDSPMQLKEGVVPANYTEDFLPNMEAPTAALVNKHPALNVYRNKLSLLEIEQRLKREKLKPKLKLKYNPLLGTSSNIAPSELAIDNYKIGGYFSMPILRRTAKANLEKGNIKVYEYELAIEDKRNQIQNKIDATWAQQLLLVDQLKIQAQNTDNYKLLLDKENEKFKYGESSVFLLNKRQEKYIKGQLKLIDTYIQRQQVLLDYLYYSNQLN